MTRTVLNSVLLIDDDAISNFLNTRLLKEMQVTRNIKVTLNGEEALQFLQQEKAANHPFPELILLDINMPVMNGFEFLEAFREVADENNHSVIIILTTSTNTRDFEQLQRYAEVEIYLSKPLTEENLQYILYKHFPED
ncbi:response regulator [Adhaeribacter arboris]|uniref:Response regulator n=1 Tax=Adhaeribacter arboris TaxID=2072846 RepID=A0A2T2YMD8_9BACT|nr:response regulator [Adhaeribacter arboris]PSR56674.1 response regulator [Adhaeribacter arboris]